MAKYGIIILAAGSSSRLGRPKQLLVFEGTTLIEHVVRQACAVSEALTVVVSGAIHNEIQTALATAQVSLIYNPDWVKGMSASLQVGLKALLNEAPGVKACILMVCDQPYVSTTLLEEMIHSYENNAAEIVACTYAETAGTPALFGACFFDDLLSLGGQAGAKKIIAENETNVFYLPFPMGRVDIDTAQDYVTFISRHP
jgi:molybdenum cofactor cytidylyltransferase